MMDVPDFSIGDITKVGKHLDVNWNRAYFHNTPKTYVSLMQTIFLILCPPLPLLKHPYSMFAVVNFVPNPN
jgi:hypothetical protein